MNYPGSLHNHTDFSNLRLRDSINKIPTLIDKAIELGHTCVAITDHESISGFVQIEEYAETVKDKIKVIRGNEIYLTRNGLNAANFNKEKDDYYHFILLAKDLIGYHQLCELSTRAWLRSYISRRMRRVPTYYRDIKEIIGTNPGHIIASTACIGGQLPKFILKFRETNDINYLTVAKNWCQYMVNIFGEGNFFLELQPSKNQEQIFVNTYLLELSQELNIPYIITTDSHYLSKEDSTIHEKYLNSQDGDREVKAFYATTYMMETRELESFFPYMTREQLDNAYINIKSIAEKCEEFTIKRPLRIPELPWISHNNVSEEERIYYKQLMPALIPYETSSYLGDKEIINAVIAGIKKHPDLQNQEAYDALNECLEMTWESSQVNNACWSAYYLNLQKIIQECWNAGTIVLPARGSGGGFVLLYCLDIIQMNCLREETKMFPWRFMNPKRASVVDLDTDISGLKRAQVLQYLRQVYGEDRVCNVLTLRTEKSKSAILTAARGVGLPPEEGSYLASLVSAERGQLYSLKQMYYGDENNGIKPSSTFVEEMNKHKDVWEVAQRIEGLICGIGIHAGGIVFNDEPFTNTCSLMRAPDGTIISGFELHDIEKCSLIKMDLLSVEGADKIQLCLELLMKEGYIDPSLSIQEAYEQTIGVYNLERTDPKMWSMVHNHEITSLFQMEQQSGIQGIAATKPTSVGDLATLNSVIRLMATEKGAESPIEKYARFRSNPEAWDEEMKIAGLTEEERYFLHKHLDVSSGLSIAQEQFMGLVQLPELGGFDLQWADKLRKSIAKKSPKDYELLTKEFYKNMEDKKLSKNLCHYVWDVQIAMNKGYAFNFAHTSGYSLVALQEMNLAYKYPIIFWNTANLIVDSAGVPETEEGDNDCIITELEDDPEGVEEIVDIYEPEEWEEYEYEDLPDRSAKKKKKTKSVNFGKIATAIGKFQAEGINISPPNINKSDFTFTPVVETNTIVSGLRNLTRVSADLVSQIIANRPYSSIEDFMAKVKTNKTQMLTLIKCGAFDEIYPNRMELLNNYITSIAGTKNKLTLANVPMLIKYDVLPEECKPYVKLFSYNKFLRKCLDKDNGLITIPTTKAADYYCDNFDVDLLMDDKTITLKNWEKQYKKAIAPFSDFIKSETDVLLRELNKKIVKQQFDLDVGGNISHGEMEAMSFYYHEHELANINRHNYRISNFNNLPEEPPVERVVRAKDGKEIPIYRLFYIAGTVIDKNKLKNSISLLTTDGVVTVKIWKNQYAKYDKQISVVGEDGKKHVMEKSWFKRGTLLYLQGFRRGNNFIPKAYKGHGESIPIMKIIEVDGEDFTYTNKRFDEE